MGKKYLIIGSAATDDPKTHGGTTVLVKQLLEYFHENDKDYLFIQAMKYQGKFAFIWNYLYVMMKLLQNIRKVDLIMVNVAINGAYYLAPPILFICRLFNKKFIFRRFAGGFINHFEASKGIKKYLINYVIDKSDILFFEPKYMVNYFSKLRGNVYWFPNTRKRSKIIRDKNLPFQKKLVYLGQIRKEKGIDELLEASKALGNEYRIDLYGTLFDKRYNETFLSEYPNITYKGRVHNENVNITLVQYDILILPSYMEGYPGVIIEAFSVGLPVVATNLPSIKEMVGDEDGVLVDPENTRQLVEAIKSFNKDNYQDFSKHVLKKFDNFEYEFVYKNIIDICENIEGEESDAIIK